MNFVKVYGSMSVIIKQRKSTAPFSLECLFCIKTVSPHISLHSAITFTHLQLIISFILLGHQYSTFKGINCLLILPNACRSGRFSWTLTNMRLYLLIQCNKLCNKVLFPSCSSCLEELTFSAERIEIFFSSYQVTNNAACIITHIFPVVDLPTNNISFVLQKHKKELEGLLAR